MQLSLLRQRQPTPREGGGEGPEPNTGLEGQ